MNVKELRIGNYLNHSELGIVEIIAVGKDYIHCVFNGETFYEGVRCFSPIPLTEEIILKAGFEGSDFDKKYNPNDEFNEQFYYKLKSGISYRDFECYPSKGWVVKLGDYNDELVIEHLHQLQNIIFDLTGKEIEFKI